MCLSNKTEIAKRALEKIVLFPIGIHLMFNLFILLSRNKDLKIYIDNY